MPSATLILGATAVLIAFVFVRSRIRRHNRHALPPGPKGYPVIGNALDIPRRHEHLRFTEWYKTYGDIVHIEAFGQSFIILNTQETALDLLEKRSGNYSDRPCGTMLLELIGCNWMFAFINYGPEWKTRRKIFQSAFHPQGVKTFGRIQEQKTLAFLNRLLTFSESKDELERVVHFYNASIILAVIYGYHIKEENDEIDRLCSTAVSILVETMNQTFMVDLLPILKHIPSWFPFAKFKRDAERWKRDITTMRDKPFEYTQKYGGSENCLVSQHLSRYDALPEHRLEEEMRSLKDSAALAYIAGMDTNKAAIRSFCLAMILYPEVQKRGQAEVDRILGEPGTRLPNLEDQGSIPYVRATVSEVLRWHPFVPIGIPHRSVHDDTYKGYFIPAGSIVFGNAWAILTDPAEYPNPEVFDPSRFLPQDGVKPPLDPFDVMFGFGRRSCPGIYLSAETLWIAIASLFATFDILPALEKDGKTPIIPSTDYEPGSISAHSNFPCRFVPRSERVTRLISSHAPEME